MQIVYKRVEELNPYKNNPRNNEDSVDAVANSIKEFGFKVPIIIDTNNVIITGHTRLKAAKKLGLKEVPVIIADDLNEEQIKAFRIADNSTSELSTWDFDKLNKELESLKDFNMEDFNLVLEDLNEIIPIKKENKYTQKMDVPQYEITGINPGFEELYDLTKYKELIKEIESNNDLNDDEREFLKFAATRHIVFNYSNIAEHYAHSNKEVQELMEKSALVIIDFDDALKNGYVKLNNSIRQLLGADDEA